MPDFAQNTNSESGRYTLINAYEELVKSNVWDFMDKDGEICKCEKCFLDVCALVLNNEHTRYTRFVTTKKGALLAQIPEMKYSKQVEMTVIILDSIRIVKESPMHGT